MPRNGSNVYNPPADTLATTLTTIKSANYNAFVNDVTADLNLARPIVAGGTGATTKQGAVDALFDGTTVFTHPAFASINGGPLNGFRNKLINGDFDSWQRATTQTTSGYGSDDRWNNENSGSTKTASQQTFALGQTLVPGNPKFFARTVVTSSASAGNYVRKTQRIEGVRTLSGRTVTLTFYGSSDASRNIAVEFVQNFGTGGSPSSAVTSIGSQLVALTTTFAKKSVTIAIPSISGKTLGSGGNDYLELVIWYDAGSTFNARAASLGQQSGQFDIAHVSIVEGDATSETDPFSPRHIQQEMALCERYFQIVSVSGQSASTGNFIVPWYCSTPMRTNGALNVAFAGNASNAGGSSDICLNSKGGYAAFQAFSAGGYVTDRRYNLDAEL